MQARIFLLCFFCLFFGTAVGAEIILNGIYKGKDLYVQNPYSKGDNRFCTEAVYVNGQLFIENPATSAFRINLSDFTINEQIMIKIQHSDSCSPRILNPEVIIPSGTFEFITAKAGPKSILWLSKNELPDGIFTIEKKKARGEWSVIKEVTGYGQSRNYEVAIDHEVGENIYRIRYKGANDVEWFSPEINYSQTEAPVSFTINEASTKIYLSKETEYLITDVTGRKYKYGRDKIISIHTLKPGDYLLHIQGRKESFTRKAK